MLIILFGVSGVGKTTIIEYLIKKYKYNPVKVFTTRILRKNEKIKIHLSEKKFKELLDLGAFLWVNEFYGVFYGTSKNDIINALKSSERYILDYSINSFKDVENLPCTKIIINPECIEALEKQIKKARRVERLESAVRDYETNYNDEVIKEYQKKGVYIVTNYFNNLELAVNEVRMIVEGGKEIVGSF